VSERVALALTMVAALGVLFLVRERRRPGHDPT
jgi:hypothetical protein